MQDTAVLRSIRSCYKLYEELRERPPASDIVELLHSQIETFNDVFIVIDALDECPETDQTRKALITYISALLPKIKLMVTSQNIPSIENMFLHDTRLEIRAQDEDVRKFVESQTERRDDLVDLLEGHEDVRSSIIKKVLEKANGMSVNRNVFIGSKLIKRQVLDCSLTHGFFSQGRQHTWT